MAHASVRQTNDNAPNLGLHNDCVGASLVAKSGCEPHVEGYAGCLAPLMHHDKIMGTVAAMSGDMAGSQHVAHSLLVLPDGRQRGTDTPKGYRANQRVMLPAC